MIEVTLDSPIVLPRPLSTLSYYLTPNEHTQSFYGVGVFALFAAGVLSTCSARGRAMVRTSIRHLLYMDDDDVWLSYEEKQLC